MDDQQNFYQILHVSQDAPVEIIRSSYRTLMQRLKRHPDLGGDHVDAALINEAYAVLTNPQQRAEYDRQLLAGAGTETDTATQPSRDAAGAAAQPDAPSSFVSCPFCGSVNDSGTTINPGSICDNCHSPLCPAERHRFESEGQRAVARIQRRHPIVVFTEWPEKGTAGETQDISLNGMRFVSARPLATGQCIKIDGNLLQAIARVTHCSEQAANTWVVGVAFVTLRFSQSQGSFVSAKV